ncbi:MAG: phosphoglucosamine mutase [Fimbriimonadaceae bacterium]|nr:phosphoglucosamine mutase [Chthonomonadaceae bacterium]MCO5295290.1 phosphoglucosamine mutase [Fimbriimonadaceae bacterium]
MSRRHFGTDGIRGVANEKLTPELAFALGRAAGHFLHARGLPRRAVMGRDTRRSGPMLGAALASGLCSTGVDVVSLGVVPTPTVSYAARTGEFGLGAILSASHNPAPDNGIKLVGHDGCKLADSVELELEAALAPEAVTLRPTGGEVGSLESDRALVDAYLDTLVAMVPERLDGMQIAVDAAHGAAFELAPEVLVRLGAEVYLTGAEPDGMNINAEGGATKPDRIGAFTLETEAEFGVAFDGDADRAVFCDERGRLINGDRTIGIWSGHWQRHGLLEPRVVVGTVMSNGGFERYLLGRGVRLERTPVGDKYVAQRLIETGAKIGGEQSGHIIFPAHGPTGDGLVTMLEMLRVLRRESRPASAFYEDYESWPQVLINVAVASRDGWDAGELVREALASGEQALAGHGRLVVRPSGTQPMVRVMVEADTYALRDEVADQIVSAMQSELDGRVYSKVDLTHALGD